MAPTSKHKGRDSARSRNSTPMSTSTEPTNMPVAVGSMTYTEILDICRGTSTPSSAILLKIKEGLIHRSEIAKTRSDAHDKGMRESSKRKKEEGERQREYELARRAEEERLEKSKQTRKEQEDRPLAVGAHSVARQDGVSNEDTTMKDGDRDPVDDGERTHPHSPAPDDAESSIDSVSETHQLRPAPAIPQYQTFGPDPSKFDDPTIYHIRDISDDMDDEEKREILGVASFPRSDLYDLTCGTAADRDLTNAKPSHQYTAQQFATWMEPFFRPYTEEDKQFLLERGDRSGPMIIPPRGAKGYKDVWNDEDNASYGDSISNTQAQASNTNQGNGSIEQMSDEAAEKGEWGVGPMLARLMQCLLPEARAPPSDNTSNNHVNGDTAMTNGVDGDDSIVDPPQHADNQKQHPPATRLPEVAMPPPSTANANSKSSSTGPGANSSVNGSKPNWAEVDDRVKLELRYLGFLPEDAVPDYESHHDDEVAARLRWLQEELQRVSTMNGARKARVLEMVEDDMARQEWSSIADDLDSQLNQAYLKRHRNSGKGRGKLKRAGAAAGYSGAGVNGVAGGAAGAGIGRPVMGEQIKELLRRRGEWRDYLGPVVDFGRRGVPEQSCFDEMSMEELLSREREGWSEAQDGP